jgi:hypothetical protein
VRDGLVYDFIPEYGSNWHVGPILLITWELTFRVNIHAMFYLTNGAVAHIKPASATPPRSPNLSLAREGRDGDDGAGGGREVGGCAGPR